MMINIIFKIVWWFRIRRLKKDIKAFKRRNGENSNKPFIYSNGKEIIL